MIKFRKYTLFLSPLMGLGIGLAGGIFAIAVLRLIGRLPSPLQEKILLFVFAIGGFTLALMQLIARIRIIRRHNSKSEGQKPIGKL